jgi:hypothetical protein
MAIPRRMEKIRILKLLPSLRAEKIFVGTIFTKKSETGATFSFMAEVVVFSETKSIFPRLAFVACERPEPGLPDRPTAIPTALAVKTPTIMAAMSVFSILMEPVDLISFPRLEMMAVIMMGRMHICISPIKIWANGASCFPAPGKR